MTQRIFDVDNPQDVKDLFELVPNKVQKIRWSSDANIFSDEQNNVVISCSFICIAWRDKTEITRPADESQWIGKLCWFWDKNFEKRALGVLKVIDIESECPYKMQNYAVWQHCRPVRREKAKAFIESSNSKYLTKQYGVRIIPVSRTSKRINNDR